jgi:pimeloyl-ACP methyl ester carboxylesterase
MPAPSDQHVRTSAGPVAVSVAGPPDAPAVVFLHGWPQSRVHCAPLVERAAAAGLRGVAMDLPGIGDSAEAHTDGSTPALADVVGEVITGLDLRDPVVAGQDIGGMTAWQCLRRLSGLRGVVIMNVVVPGVEPWSKVYGNPSVWHFRFHAVPHLPEAVVAGREDVYFDWFFDLMAAQRTRITPQSREAAVRAYRRPGALAAGFDFYRALPADAEAAGNAPTDVPLLYLRGAGEWGDIAEYADGFRAAGVANLSTAVVPDCGHYSTDENPDGVWDAVHSWIGDLA